MRYRMLLVIAAVAVNAAGSVPPSAGLRTLKVSSFGFDPVDSTHFLQRAFDADVDVVVVDRQPTDWIAGPLFLTNSNIKDILEDGVVLRAKSARPCAVRILFVLGLANLVLVVWRGWSMTMA